MKTYEIEALKDKSAAQLRHLENMRRATDRRHRPVIDALIEEEETKYKELSLLLLVIE